MALTADALMMVARQAEEAGFGKREEVYQRFCATYNISRASLLRQLNKVRKRERKVRSDFGEICLTREEAETIAAVLVTTPRANGKQTAGIKTALRSLRANNMIAAERVDTETGEVIPLSVSAVSRGLRYYNLHPEQLNQPKPVMRMRSLHPNHVWQIDPSICVLYYLNEGGEHSNNLCVMEEAEFYKNKPENVARIAKQRVWRYVLTDHTSGLIYVQYVLGGETTQNLCDVFISAMQHKNNADFPFRGVPKFVMLDKGSANKSFAFKRLCASLGVKLITHEKGNPRAKGQVEKANDIVEREFEWGLKFISVNSLRQLNYEAEKWMVMFNQEAIHTRTGRSRLEVWNTITSEQLTEAPNTEICRELAVTNPKEVKVNADLTIKFNGSQFSVADIREAVIGSKVAVSRNPWREECCQVLRIDADGHEFWTVLEPVVFDSYNFMASGAIIGEEIKSHKEGILQENLKSVKRRAMNAVSETEREAKEKAKALPFDGKLEPYKYVDDYNPVMYLPKRGQEHELTANAKRVELVPLNPIEVAKRLKAKFGEEYSADTLAWINQRYPNGMTEPELEALLAQPHLPQTAKPLRVVNS